MKPLKLTAIINRSAREVFAFTIDPKNTPSWVDFIEHEETSEWPVRLGTVYRNHGADKDA